RGHRLTRTKVTEAPATRPSSSRYSSGMDNCPLSLTRVCLCSNREDIGVPRFVRPLYHQASKARRGHSISDFGLRIAECGIRSKRSEVRSQRSEVSGQTKSKGQRAKSRCGAS